MTQAQVKTDVPLDSDSLISIAYRKYDGDWWGDKGIRSNFYMGETFFNGDKPRDAMKYYLSAYEESKRLDNDYWRAKAAERIADLFFDAYNYEEAAKYHKEAIKFFEKSGRFLNQGYVTVDLAIDYTNDSKFKEAIFILDSLYNKTVIENSLDTLFLQYIRRCQIDALVYSGRINELDSFD